MQQDGAIVATEVYGSVLKGGKIIKIEPSSCIPFIQVRDLISSGVNRLKKSYCENDDHNLAKGAVAGGFIPTVVKLSGSMRHYALEYFMEEYNLSENKARAHVASRDAWYGVVDGSHRLAALKQLQEEMPERWFGFEWCVLLLSGDTSLSTLRAFARAQNLRQSDSNYIQTTLFDLLQGLQEERNRLSIELGGRRPNYRELSESYSASRDRTTSTLRQLAGISLRLSETVVEEVGEIMNFECSKLACTYYSLRGRASLSPDTVASILDCLVYRNFLTPTSLNQAKTFMQSKDPGADEARINTLHRLKEICRLNGFKPVSGKTVNEQFLKAVAALHEAKKFEKLLQSEVWPKGMEILRANLLRDTVLDAEVDSNHGNENEILPTLLANLRRILPAQAPLLEARFLAARLAPRANNCEDAEGVQKTSAELLAEHGDQSSKDLQIESGEGEKGRKENEGPQAEHESGREIAKGSFRSPLAEQEAQLTQLGINTFHMRWQEYNTAFQDTTEGLFDLILTEPPRGIAASARLGNQGHEEAMTEKEMKEFVNFAKRILLPGGYLILFTPAKMMIEWIKLLRGIEFTCVDYPFVVARGTLGLQRTNRLLFPQNVCELAVMAVAPGKHPKGFKANFDSQYHLVNCSYKRKFALMDAVEVVKRKLKFEKSKAFVRAEEKNPSMLAEIMVTFSPDGGRVMDPFAGTMSTAIACMAAGRQGVVIESDAECYDLALARVRSMVSLYASSGPKSARGNSLHRTCKSREQSISENSDLPAQSGSESSDHGEGMIRNASEDSIPPETPADILSEELCEVLSSKKVPLAGEEVELLMEGEVVGSATIQRDFGNNGYRTSLHGFPLSLYSNTDEELVVIWRVRVKDHCLSYSYPYSYGGVEGPVKKLGEMVGGFYAWDLHAMSLIPRMEVGSQ